MTTEIEEQFYKTFEINKRCCHDNYKHQKEVCHRIPEQCQDYQYPEITAEKLLKIICIIADGKDGDKNLNLYTANEDEWFAVLKDKNNLAYCAAIDTDFKNAILKLCIYRADINDFKHQIQQLFKERNYDK